MTINHESIFDEVVRSVQADGRAVVALFTAPAWCIPCRRFEPHWLKASEDPDLSGMAFVKVIMGESPEDTSKHWATPKFNILGVPNVRFFKSGQEAVDIQARAIVPLKKELLNFERA